MKITQRLKLVTFQIGVNCIGLPEFHQHQYTSYEYGYATIYHEKFHKSKKP